MGTVWSDQIIQSDSKRVGICFYYKESLGVKIINLSARNECILCKVSMENCKDFIAVRCRSPSQDNDQFGKFLSSTEDLINKITLSNPLMSDLPAGGMMAKHQ